MPLCSVTRRVHFNKVEKDVLIGAECGALAVTVKKSAISHLNAGFGLFAARRFGTGETVGPYCIIQQLS